MLNRLLAIIRKDTILRFEGRTELLFFLILPVVFTLIMGGGFAGAPEGDGDDRLLVPVVDEDASAESAAFMAALAASDAIRPESMPRDDADALLDEQEVGAVLIIPAGFGAGLSAEGILAGGPAALTMRVNPASNTALAVEQAINRAVGEVARPLLAARNATQAIDAVRPFAGDAARAAFFAGALAAAEAEPAPPARVAYEVAVAEGTNDEAFDTRAHTSAGQLITWVFIPLLGAAGLFAYERAIGTMRRLLVTPTRHSSFLVGAISSQFLLALVQMIILVAFGALVLKVPWAHDPLALAVVLVSFGLAGVAMGTMLGTFVRSEGQASNLAIMLGMVMALLGGAWFPMELFPPVAQSIARILPTYWAMQAMTDLTMRGQGLAGVLPEAGVLLVFAAVFFAAGVLRFRYE